ncbi:MAG: hypothetical protein HN919_04560 [Verrucomicrobia bacterium]|jgi:hypothetical protein|nr:hypothetical protein [Verrucomicrobiota bacterium]MBT7702574.1 hypothetical protein [Verrucomicrobiota bacterium]
MLKIWAATVLLMTLSAVGGAPLYAGDVNAAYYWGVGSPEAVPASEILFFAGEATFSGKQLSFSAVNLPERFPAAATLSAVLRFSQPVLVALLSDRQNAAQHVETILDRATLMSARLGRTIDLQIDGDCSQDQIDDYLSFIRLLERSYENKVSLTAVASWLAPSVIEKTRQSGLCVYYMLYTMHPSQTLSAWQGELPLVAWDRAISRLRSAVDARLIRKDNALIVLPCYTLVTLYDHQGRRMWRGSEDDWLRRALAGNSAALSPSELRRREAFGSISSWTVLRSGKYGPHIVRAGSTVIREVFGLSDWQEAASHIEKISADLGVGLFHCGGVGTTGPTP